MALVAFGLRDEKEVERRGFDWEGTGLVGM